MLAKHITTPFLKDARHFQIVYLSLFLCYGIFALGWDANLMQYLALIGGCLLTQAIGIGFTTKDFRGLKSALITALGLCLLLKTNGAATAFLAAVLAIGSKYVIRINNKHLFNPANFGIIAAVVLTNDAWVSPGQWGNEALMLYFMGAAALMVLLKVGRIDTSLAFLSTFAVLEYLRTIVYLGWEWDVLTHKLGNGTILLFAFFMITDPMTTPNASRARLIWAAAVAVGAFVLTNWVYLHTAPIWVLFVVSPITVLLDKLFVHKRYQWLPTRTQLNSTPTTKSI